MSDTDTGDTDMSDSGKDAETGWLARLKSGLGRTSQNLTQNLNGLLNNRKLDDTLLGELEDILIAADLGVSTAAKVTSKLATIPLGGEVSTGEVKEILVDAIAEILHPVAQPFVPNPALKPHVVLVCGVNGSGKTTTIGKLAHALTRGGKTVVLAAGDTFRAAAAEQLQIWGERTGCQVIARDLGTDPAGLVFDALAFAKEQSADVLLIDTAGRLQNRTELMAELQKTIRVMQKLDETAPHTCLQVLDATVGQNAHSQVEIFSDLINVDGLVLTKLDGSAKGGVLVALAEKFGLPVHAIGVGEQPEDLQSFDAREFAGSLLGPERNKKSN